MDALPSAVNDDEEHALRLDVRRTLKNLAPHERDLCRYLSSGKIADVARLSGKARATIYDACARMRDHFERAGLRDYLNCPDRSDSAPVGTSMPIARSRR